MAFAAVEGNDRRLRSSVVTDTDVPLVTIFTRVRLGPGHLSESRVTVCWAGRS